MIDLKKAAKEINETRETSFVRKTFTGMFENFAKQKKLSKFDCDYFLKITKILDDNKMEILINDVEDIINIVNDNLKGDMFCDIEDIYYIFDIPEIKQYIDRRSLLMVKSKLRKLVSQDKQDSSALAALQKLELQMGKFVLENSIYIKSRK